MSNVIKATAELDELWRQLHFMCFSPSTALSFAMARWAQAYPGTEPAAIFESNKPRLLCLGPAPRREISESPNGPKAEPEGEPTVSFTVAAAADIGYWSDPGWEPDASYPEGYGAAIKAAKYRRRGRGWQWVFTNVPLPVAELIAEELFDMGRISVWGDEERAEARARVKAAAAIRRAIGEVA